MKTYKIGFCPTMQPYVDSISSKVDEVEMIEYGSAAQVLSLLYNGDLDGVLIGRIASKFETDNETNFIRFKEGITLAFKTKYALPEEQLKQVDVMTYLKPEQVEHLKHFFNQIIYLETLDKCLEHNLEVPVLVDWNDFRDDFQLLIPMNNFGKTQEFRAPVLYYKNIDNEIIKRIKKSLE